MAGENAKSFTVLLAESKDADSNYLQQLLKESGAPHRIVRVASFEETESYLRKESADVLLISLALLGRSGSALARLRKAAPLIPIVVLARDDDTVIGLNVLREGAKEYLVKENLSPSLLYRTIRYAIERNWTELALKESEDRLRDLVENSHDLICTHDLEGNILWVNPFPAVLLGYEPAELKQMKIQDLLTPKFRNKFAEYIKKILTDGAAEGVMNVVTRAGEIRIWAYHNSLRTEGVDRPIIRGIAHDITDLTNAQELLRQSQERFQLASLASHDVIWDWNVPAETIWWSETLQEVFGHPASASLDFSWWSKHIHPDEAEMIQAKRNAFLNSKHRDYTLEYRFQRSDGSYSNVLERGFIVSEEGRVTRIIGALTDISDRIKYEEQVLLSRKVDAIVGLAGGIAHDFNNLMMAIHVNCEVIKLKLPDQFANLPELAAILDSAVKGSILTHQLLSFSRKQIIQPRALDVGGFILAMKPLLEDILGDGIRCVIDPVDSSAFIQADASLLREVFTVLAANSREAMNGKGEIRVHTECVLLDDAAVGSMVGMSPGSYLKLDFSDTGIGMNPEVRDRMFEPYFSTKEVGHGQGLSLASVYGIIKQNQGHIYAESEPGKGTTFHLLFPLTTEMPS